MLSGRKGFERENVKADPVAHAEYKRVSALMKAVGKDDALYSAIVNRYCELFSEIDRCRQESARLRQLMDRLEQLLDSGEVEDDFYNVSTGLPIGMVVTEGLLRSSDAGYYAIGFRAIPKGNAEKKENPLAAILGGG